MPRHDRILRFFGLVFGLAAGLAVLCLGVILIGRSADTDTSCLVARDNNASIFVDVTRGMYFGRVDVAADSIDIGNSVASPDAKALAYSFRFTDAVGQARATVFVRHWTGVVFSRRTPILNNIALKAANTFIYIGWSPDSQWLLITWDDAEGLHHTSIVDSEGHQRFSPDDTGQLMTWGWSADSAYYGFTKNQLVVLWARDSHQFTTTNIPGDYLVPSPAGHHFAAISVTNTSKFDLNLYTPGEESQHIFPLADKFQTLQPDLYWSPDGQHLVITTLTSKGVGSSFSWMNLDEYGVDGTTIPQLTESVNAGVTQSVSMGSTLTWSPDSRRIVYISQVQNEFSIRAFDISTRHSEVLLADTDKNFQLLNPTYLVGWRGGRPLLLNLTTGAWFDLPLDMSDLGTAELSPDGHVLVVMKQFTIRLVNIETSQNLAYVSDDNVFDHHFVWSPDGKQVAIVYRTNIDYVQDIVTADGLLLQRIKTPTASVTQPWFKHTLSSMPFYWTMCRG